MLMMSADAEHNDMDGSITIVTTATLGQTMTVIMTVPKTMTTTMMRTDNAAGGDDDQLMVMVEATPRKDSDTVDNHSVLTGNEDEPGRR